MSHYPGMPHRSRIQSGLIALTLVLVALLNVPTAEALRSRSSGAGGCGNFSDALDAAEPGDVLIPMVDNDGGRNSGGASILVNDLLIEGGWTPPSSNCPTTNFTAATPAELLAAGFSYAGLDAHAHLFAVGAPVVTIGSAIKKLTVQGLEFEVRDNVSANGAGMSGTGLSGATLRMKAVKFYLDPANLPLTISGSGGGLYLDIDGGSDVSIDGASFDNLRATSGGGFTIVVRGGSRVTLKNLTVRNNVAESGNGGGGRIIVYSGYVTITDSLFDRNGASGNGSQLAIERPIGAVGPAEVTLRNTMIGNTLPAANTPLYVTGPGLTFRNLTPRLFMPLALNGRAATHATITGLVRNSSTYTATFTTDGFTPSMGGRHVHFFYDTVPPSQAGMPGSGPWFVYESSAPFTQATVANRPFGATKLCILVANADHSVIQGTGNCVTLP